MQTQQQHPMEHFVSYRGLLDKMLNGSISGMSELTIRSHFSIYEKMVSQCNRLYTELNQASTSQGSSNLMLQNLRRRFNYTLNAVVLHELYFSNLITSQNMKDPSDNLKRLISDCYGSTFDRFMDDFKACSLLGMDASGWVIACFEPNTKKILVTFIDDYNLNVPVGCQILLAMDTFDHSYILDHGVDGLSRHISNFLGSIDWMEVERRCSLCSQGRLVDRHTTSRMVTPGVEPLQKMAEKMVEKMETETTSAGIGAK